MFSKWSDAYAQLQGFINSTIKTKRLSSDNIEHIEKLDHARCEIIHLFTVLSAVSVERLARGDIRRMEMRRRKGVAWQEQVVFRENLREKDLTGSRNLIPFTVVKLKDSKFSVMAPEYSDEGDIRPIEEDMDEDEKEEALNAKKKLRMQIPSRTRMSLVLAQIRDNWEHPVSVVGDLSRDELVQLRDAKDRPGLVLMWLGELVTDLQPTVLVPPPILSRVYQELSNGSLGFSQAMKLSDIPFPFIFAQMLAVSITGFAVISPIAFTVISGDSWMTPVLSTGAVLAFWALNEIAMELENPFGEDANNLPLYDAHERFAEYCIELHGTCLPKGRCFASSLRDKERLSVYLSSGEGPGSLQVEAVNSLTYASADSYAFSPPGSCRSTVTVPSARNSEASQMRNSNVSCHISNASGASLESKASLPASAVQSFSVVPVSQPHSAVADKDGVFVDDFNQPGFIG